MNKPDPKIQQVLSLMDGDIDYQRYFFINSSSTKIFPHLKTAGYFNPEKIRVENGNAEYWLPVNYLERISKIQEKNTEYGKELVGIIGSVVLYSKSKTKLNNFYNWWGLLKILIALPNQIIRENVGPDLFQNWLAEFVGPGGKHNPITHDISGELFNKFLEDDSMFDYSVKIFETMIEIKKNPKEDNYFRRNEVLLVWDEYWLWETFSGKKDLIVYKLFTTSVIYLANKLNSALEFENKVSWINVDIGTEHYRICVYRVLENGLTDEKIGFKKDYYNCKFKKYSSDQVSADEEIFKQHRLNVEPSIELPGVFSFSAHTNEELVKAIKDNLPNGIFWNTDPDFEEKLTHLFENFIKDYSTTWFKSLENGVQHFSHADEILGMMLRDFLVIRYSIKPDEVKEVLRRFLSNEFKFTIFKRLALFLINKDWDQYSSLFLSFLNSAKNPLSEFEYEVELHDILKNHNLKFSPDLKTEITRYILDVPKYYQDKGEKYENYWKYKWYSPLSDNTEFSKAFTESKNKAGIEGEQKFIPERYEDQGRFLVNLSPISKDQILKSDLLEVIKILKEFKTTDEMAVWNGKPDRKGLADALFNAVQENPEKFENGIDDFIDVPPLYVRHILIGLKMSLVKGQVLNWVKLINFIYKYFEKVSREPNSWKDETNEDDIPTIYLISESLDLIENGLRSNPQSFDENLKELVEKIFDQIYPFLSGEEPLTDNSDVLDSGFRSILGRTVRNYIEITLRFKRIKIKMIDNWGNEKYERFLKLGYEPNIWLGVYVIALKEIDKSYIEEKIKYFALLGKENIEWSVFVQGYLEGSYITDEMYRLMRPLYEKLFLLNLFNPRVEEKIVSHFCTGYLQGFENLELLNENGQISLFRKLLEDATDQMKRTRWIQVPITFTDFLGEKEIIGKEEKVLNFWRWTYANRDHIKEKLNESYSTFLEKILSLMGFSKIITQENEDWILLSIPHCDQNRGLHFLIENLDSFEDGESIQRIARILKELLKYTIPMYQDDKVKNIVKKIFEMGIAKKNTALFTDGKEICNTFARRGLYFLKSLYDEFQTKMT